MVSLFSSGDVSYFFTPTHHLSPAHASSAQHTHREDEEPKRAKGGDSTPHQLGFGVFVIDSCSSSRLRATFCLTIDMYSYHYYVRTCRPIPFFVWAPVRCWLNSSFFFNVNTSSMHLHHGFLSSSSSPPTHSSFFLLENMSSVSRTERALPFDEHCSLQEPQKHLFFFSFFYFFFSFKLERRAF